MIVDLKTVAISLPVVYVFIVDVVGGLGMLIHCFNLLPFLCAVFSISFA